MNTPRGEETIFAEALRLPPEERAAYLAQATHGNAALRRRVEALLGSYGAGDFLEQAAAPQLRETRHITVPLTEKAGDTIGRYKLLQQIGEGGCGVVYMAEQAEPVRRRVALKIIKLGMDTKSVIARFEAERQAVALMDHPNIAKVFDAGATEAGRPYFVMELVRGMKITDYCDEAKLSTRARLDLFIQVCQAIQHAHQKGIIHRDIKPSNILVSANDGVLVPKVIDFGIAKATSGQQLTDKTLFTAFEQFIGTPAYMSPEQAVITNVDIDTRSDIYALGVLLYELLTGKTPFDAKELLAIGLDEMRRTIREQEPQRPSTRLSTLPGQELSTTAQRRGLDAPKLVSELRGDLDWIVMKALEKDRARRYETANGLAMDVQRHLDTEPVIARPPSALYRFQKTVRRNKLAVTATGAVVGALIIGLGISLSMWRRAETESVKSREVAQFLKDMLKGVQPSVALGRDQTMLREILDATAERIVKELAEQPEVQVELLNTIGFAYRELGEFGAAKRTYVTSLDLMRRLWGNDHPEIAATLHNLAEMLRYFGPFQEAEMTERQALAMNQRLFGREHPAVAASLNNLAFVLGGEGKLAEAETLFREALPMNRKLLGDEHPQVGICLSRFGTVLEAQGKLPEAEAMYREAVVIQVKLLGKNSSELPPDSSALAPNIELGWTLDYLSRVLEKQSKLSEAETTMRQAIAVMTQVVNPGNAGRLELLRHWIRFNVQHGQPPQVEAAYRDILEALRGGAEKGEVAALNELAWLLATCSHAAIRDGKNAVTFAEKAVAATNRKNAGILDTLAAAYAEAGDFVKAADAEREAIGLSQKEKRKNELAARLKLYESNTPYREP